MPAIPACSHLASLVVIPDRFLVDILHSLLVDILHSLLVVIPQRSGGICFLPSYAASLVTPNLLREWTSILGVALLAIAGECLIAAAMRRLGDLDHLRTGPGLRGYLGPIRAVLSSPLFLAGALCMALNFFALLFTLSIVDLSLAAPATASLTYIGNAAAAKAFLKENVDRRRWLAVLFVAIGVVLLAK